MYLENNDSTIAYGNLSFNNDISHLKSEMVEKVKHFGNDCFLLSARTCKWPVFKVEEIYKKNMWKGLAS